MSPIRTRLLIGSVALAATLLLLPPHWQESLIDVVSPWHLGVQRERNMMVAMRDGVHLRTEVLL
ncbi:MAG: hypothetical protein AAGA84_12605, partial [Pseudomonadota bacterium]